MRLVFEHKNMNIVSEILQQVHNGNVHVVDYLHLILQDLPISIGWKDSDLIHQGCNKFHAKISGLKDQEDIVGKIDFDLLPESEALVFMEDDKEILASRKPQFNVKRVAHFLKGDSVIAHLTKFPLFDKNNKITGIMRFAHMSSIGKSERIHRLLKFYQETLLQKGEKYYIEINGGAVSLTQRQAECLTHLSMGKTVKEIANIFGCKNCTVEDHILRLKKKLNLYSTSALISCFWDNPIKWF